jgi:hypothetical protein
MPSLSYLSELRSLILVHQQAQNPQDFVGFELPPLNQLILDLASLPAIHPLPSLRHLKLVDLGGDFMGKGPSRSRLAKLLLAEFFTVPHKFSNLQSLELSRFRESGTNIALAIRALARTPMLKLSVSPGNRSSLILLSRLPLIWLGKIPLLGNSITIFPS